MKRKTFITKLVINALGLAFAAYIVDGIYINNAITLIVAAVVMGVVNAFLKPLFVLLTLPFTILTFGFFLLIVNAAMFGLVALLLPGFSVDGFIPALFGWIIVSITSWVVSSIVKKDD
ncbi:MAG: phage holin family protein [Chitinivibrionales bacterium]|nr:phage holin family protein [Chitinivibrionales bacterium]